VPPDHPVHALLSGLQTGDRLAARPEGERVLLCEGEGRPVGRLSRHALAEWLPRLAKIERVEIVAMLRRRREDGDPAFREWLRSQTWEVPLVEIRLRG